MNFSFLTNFFDLLVLKQVCFANCIEENCHRGTEAQKIKNPLSFLKAG